jgi:serine/threonine protein kinase
MFGSFGKVFLVRPSRGPQSEVYAMKVLRKADVIKRHQVEHTLTERFILATIRHPFILSLRHAFQTADKLYMVTDYCPGGEIFFHLKRLRRFTEGRHTHLSILLMVVGFANCCCRNDAFLLCPNQYCTGSFARAQCSLSGP